MNQKSGDFVADGRVSTTRLPDRKSLVLCVALRRGSDAGPGAAHDVGRANQKLHYEGNAVVWQGANRVEADRIDIDRMTRVFEAHGKVVSQFADKSSADKDDDRLQNKPKRPAAPMFTVVRAADLVYTDETRLAHYQGGAAMIRPGLAVNGKELKAFLNDENSSSTLDKAFADGAVKIVSTADQAHPHRHWRTWRILLRRAEGDSERRRAAAWWIA